MAEDLAVDRDLFVEVCQGEELDLRVWSANERDDFALDPQARHGRDVLGNLCGKQPKRPGLIGRGLSGALWQIRGNSYSG